MRGVHAAVVVEQACTVVDGRFVGVAAMSEIACGDPVVARLLPRPEIRIGAEVDGVAGVVVDRVEALEPNPRGDHGGGDAVMLADIFDPDAARDPLIRAADERGGAASIMVGIAADRCFETGQPVRIADLVSGLERPDYPAMPSHSDPVPMPMRTSQD